MAAGSRSVVVDAATLTRAAAMTGSLGLVAVVVTMIVGPALVEALGTGGGKAAAATLGVLARVAAGVLAGTPARRRGAAPGSLLVSVGLGGLIGYLVFPGLVAVIGLVATGAGARSYLGLAAAAAIGAATCAAGALVTRPAAAAAPGRPVADRC